MPCSPHVLAARKLQKQTLAYLWTRYLDDHANTDLRNRLAEHYTPRAQKIAARLIDYYGLRERDAAVSDVLYMLVARLIPGHDGKRNFHQWLTVSIRNKMIDRKRMESKLAVHFKANLTSEEDWPQLESMLIRPKELGADQRFAELTTALTARDAAMLWLRFYRHLSYRQIAHALGGCNGAIHRRIRQSIAVLQELINPPPKGPKRGEVEEAEEESAED